MFGATGMFNINSHVSKKPSEEKKSPREGCVGQVGKAAQMLNPPPPSNSQKGCMRRLSRSSKLWKNKVKAAFLQDAKTLAAESGFSAQGGFSPLLPLVAFPAAGLTPGLPGPSFV